MSAQRTRNALPCPCLRTVLADPFRASRSPRFYRSCFMTQGGRFVDSCRRGSPAESAKRLIERCGCKPSVEGGEASLFRDHPKSFAAGRFGQLRHLMQATSDRPARILLPAPRSVSTRTASRQVAGSTTNNDVRIIRLPPAPRMDGFDVSGLRLGATYRVDAKRAVPDRRRLRSRRQP